jgi:hypothetical protein
MPKLSIIVGEVFHVSIGILSSYNRSCCFPSSLLITTTAVIRVIINLTVEEIKKKSTVRQERR